MFAGQAHIGAHDHGFSAAIAAHALERESPVAVSFGEPGERESHAVFLPRARGLFCSQTEKGVGGIDAPSTGMEEER
jgi:hypothetical protein